MIVNKKEKPIAKGLVGELWVTGSILCDGYLKANAKQRDNFFIIMMSYGIKRGLRIFE